MAETGTASISRMLRRAAIKDALVAPFCMAEAKEPSDEEVESTEQMQEPARDRVQGFGLAVSARRVPLTAGGRVRAPPAHPAGPRHPRRPGPVSGYTTFSADGLEDRVELCTPPPPPPPRKKPEVRGDEPSPTPSAPDGGTPRNEAGGSDEAKGSPEQREQRADLGRAGFGGGLRHQDVQRKGRGGELRDGANKDEAGLGPQKAGSNERGHAAESKAPAMSPAGSEESESTPGAKAGGEEEVCNAGTAERSLDAGRGGADVGAAGSVNVGAREEPHGTDDGAMQDAVESKAPLEAEVEGRVERADTADSTDDAEGADSSPHGGDAGRNDRDAVGQDGQGEGVAGEFETEVPAEGVGAPSAVPTAAAGAPSGMSAPRGASPAGENGPGRKNRRRGAKGRACAVQ